MTCAASPISASRWPMKLSAMNRSSGKLCSPPMIVIVPSPRSEPGPGDRMNDVRRIADQRQPLADEALGNEQIERKALQPADDRDRPEPQIGTRARRSDE